MTSSSTNPRSNKEQGHLSKPTLNNVFGEGYKGFHNTSEYKWWQKYFDLKLVVIKRPVKIQSFDVFLHRAAIEEHPGWIDYFSKTFHICNASICTKFMASLM
ncbi:hypothetical protein LguiA_007433 [Lonicera macranthoides]